MRLPLISFFLLSALVSAFPEHILSQSVKPRYNVIDRHLVREIEQLRQDWGVKGAAVAVVRREEDGSWKQDAFGLGVADARGNRVTETTLFSIASNSKLFTAIAAGLVVANETVTRGSDARLKPTTKIKDVVTSWGLMDPIASDGTDLIDLLSHRTGLPRHDGVYGVNEDKNLLISRMRHLRPSTEFRQHWQYNNLAYIVASTFPEHLYGTPFESYVHDHLLVPLGMNRTTYDSEEARRSGRRSDSFVRTGMDLEGCLAELEGTRIGKKCQGEMVDVGVVHEGRMNAGPGGVITCAKDMATWLKVLLLQGRDPSTDQTVIPPFILEAAATPWTIPYQPPTFSPADDLIGPKTYGLGQEMYSYRGHYVIEHGGAVPGQMSQVMRLPGSGLGIAVMVNDNEFGTGFYQVVQRRIVDRLLGLEPIDWAAQVKAQMINGLVKSLPPSRPANASMPDIPLESIPGIYVDEAYGELVICPVSTISNQTTDACRDTLDTNPFSVAGLTTVPTFIAHFPKFWSTHLAFTHYNGSTFTVHSRAFYPETNASIVSPFESFDAVFNSEGMAFTRNAWGAGPGVEPSDVRGGGLKERAEVWFDKQ